MITDEMLSQAARELAGAINESLPDPHECNHQFSAKFERKMKRLIKKANHPTRYNILRSAAILFLVLLLGFSSVLMVSVEAREIVFGWIRRQSEYFSEYFYEGRQNSGTTTRYAPGWMPDGYAYEKTLEIDGGEIFLFKNADGAIAQFSYTTAQADASLFIELADYQYQQVLIDGLTGDLYIAPDDSLRSELVWRDQTGQTLFSLSAIAKPEDLISAAKKIVKK